MAIHTKRAGAQEYGRYIKALIVGEPGAGKTLISSTFPNPYYANAEGGLMSVASKRVPFATIRSIDELHELKTYLEKSPEEREELLGAKVDTIVIDTIDEVQRILIRERLTSERIETLRMNDWGWLGEQMQAILRGFRNLDMNVVFTCHMKDTKDDESGRVVYKPALGGAIGNDIAGYVDLSLLLSSKTQTVIDGTEAKQVPVRYLQTYPETAYPWIKDRSGRLPERVEVNFEDDYQRIHDKIFADVDLPATEELNEKVLAKAVESLQATATTLAEPATKAEPVVGDGKFACEECGTIFTDGDQATLSKIKLRKTMCGDCYKEASKK